MNGRTKRIVLISLPGIIADWKNGKENCISVSYTHLLKNEAGQSKKLNEISLGDVAITFDNAVYDAHLHIDNATIQRVLPGLRRP